MVPPSVVVFQIELEAPVTESNYIIAAAEKLHKRKNGITDFLRMVLPEIGPDIKKASC